jgi:hypothetical protein
VTTKPRPRFSLRRRRLPALGRLLAALLPTAIACTSAPTARTPITSAASYRVAWTLLAPQPGRDLRGREVDELAIRGGELVRLEVAGPVELAERVPTGDGVAESWTSYTPAQGVVTLRTSLLTQAILAPRGAILGAHVGHGTDPGYGWFDLEALVVAWADGPLPAPFPAIAPDARIDRKGFEELDRELAAAVSGAGGAGGATGESGARAALDAARAVRRVAGLRATRELRPAAGFPYFYDATASIGPDGATTRTREGRVERRLAADSEGALTVDGPALLHVFAHAERAADEGSLDLVVREGARLRAHSAMVVPRRARRELGAEDEPAAEVLARRATVHVPPGRHTYSLRADGATAWVTAMLSEPSIHFQHAILGTRDEARALATATRACDAQDAAYAPAICAFALALLGRDDLGTTATPSPIGFGAAMAASPVGARRVAVSLSQGGPREPVLALEERAASGDPGALAALGDAALDVVDDRVRDAWFRGTVLGTEWRVAQPEAPRTWTSVFAEVDAPHPTPSVGAVGARGCALPRDPWTELGVAETSYGSVPYRGARALELLADVACDGGGPLSLEVDGQRLAPNPGASLTRWHVLVRGDTARVRRTDAAGGHVYAIRADAAACGAHFVRIGAARHASERPPLAWPANVRAPGVELWLREGADAASVDVVSTVGAPTRRVHLEARRQGGLVALDESGVRWTRVARLALPAWAAAGARLEPAVQNGAHDTRDAVAVRTIVRVARAAEPAAATDASHENAENDLRTPTPLDEARLAELSRAVLAADDASRGAAFLTRAAALADGGAARAALEDARAAKAWGAASPTGEDAVDWVRARIRKHAHPLTLAAGLAAYGLEPDFDDAAPRCAPATGGPRAELAAVAESLEAAREAKRPDWDASLAARALSAFERAPDAPRAPAVVSWSLAGSRWQAPRDVEGVSIRVQRPHEASHEGAIDPDGDLRARVAAGLPFARASYAVVSDARPARAAIPSLDGAHAYLEWACVPRAPADALHHACPFVVTIGSGPSMHPPTSAQGRGRLDLPALPAKGKQHDVTLAIDATPGRWIALARVVYDRAIEGATAEEGAGWVVRPPGLQWRFLLRPGEQLAPPAPPVAAGVASARASTATPAPRIVRIDALAEPGEHPRVVATVDGVEHAIATDGTPLVLVSKRGGRVSVRTLDGSATVFVAERVPKPRDPLALDEAEPDPAHAEPATAPEASIVATPALFDANAPGAKWRDEVSHSDRPLGTIEERLGTLNARSEARYGTYRDGSLVKQPDSADGYFEQALGYRRRIESIDLWLGVGVLERARDGAAPTFGLSALAYQEIGRLRIAAWLDYFQQDLGFGQARTVRPRGFVEYSIRLRSNVFLLPRLGWDGAYGNLAYRPTVLHGVDDDVYNAYRFARPSLAFTQLLAWWVPYVNDIFYLRARATADAKIGALDHVALRPGAFFALGDAEIGAFGEATWYRATDVVGSANVTEYTGGAYLLWNLWLVPQSVDLQPGIAARTRARDGAWELVALVNVLGSFRRGVRDYTSFELNFPEPLGGGVPWRGGLR